MDVTYFVFLFYFPFCFYNQPCYAFEVIYGENHYKEKTVVIGGNVRLSCHIPHSWVYSNMSVIWLYYGYTRRARVIASVSRYIEYYGAQERQTTYVENDRVHLLYGLLGFNDISLYIKNATEEDEGNYMCNAHNSSIGILFTVKLHVDDYTCATANPKKIVMTGCKNNTQQPSTVLACLTNESSVYRFKWFVRYSGEIDFISKPVTFGESNELLLGAFDDISWMATIAEIKCVLQSPDNCEWKPNLEASCDLNIVLPFNCRLTPPKVIHGADIIMCLDMSVSIGLTKFEKLKALVIEVLSQLFTPHSSFMASVCSFSDTVLIEKLQPARNLENLIAKLTGYPYQRFGTDTTSALLKAGRELLQRGRDGYEKIAVVLTDAYSDNHETALRAAERLKSSGIHLIMILIGDYINKDAIDDFTSLGQIVIVHEQKSNKTAGQIVEKIRDIGSAHGRDRLLECDKREASSVGFYVLVSEKERPEHNCPMYTRFDTKTCECSILTPNWHWDTCRNRGFLVYLPFNKDIINNVRREPKIPVKIFGNIDIVADTGIRGTVGSGAMFSNGLSRIEIPLFDNGNVSELFLRFRYYQISCNYPSDEYSTIVAVNGKLCRQSPFSVAVSSHSNGTATEINLAHVGQNLRFAKLFFSKTKSWIDVQIAVTLTAMKIKVGELETFEAYLNNSKLLNGLRGRYLSVGGGCKPEEPHSPMYVDELYVFDCVPYEF